MPFIAIALMVAAALGGGATIAANNSLPGDALWNFKVSVNERAQAALASGEKAKADWDISLVKTRLEEAHKLAAQGKLSAEAKADIEANFDGHAKAVATHIAKLEAKGDYATAADVAARFQATVASRVSALAEAKANANTSAQATLGGILEKAQATLDIASDISAQASAKAAANTGAGASGTVEAGAGVEVNADDTVKINL